LDIRSKILKGFIKEIQYNNRNPKDIRALELLNDISTNPERNLSNGTILFRSRVINDDKETNKESGFFGFDSRNSFVPPSKVTKDLRANYRYIPYLYCSNHPYTAIIEVRPRLSAHVSLASIQVNSNIRLLDFTMQNISSKMSDAKKNLFYDLSYLYSKPIADDDDIIDYIPTQYIAEYVKNLGYDGIAYKSSLTPELEGQDVEKYPELDRYNIVVFNYKKCAPIKSNKFEVTFNMLECQQIDDDKNTIEIYPPHLDFHY